MSATLRPRDYRVLARFRYALRMFLRMSEDAARAAGLTPTQHQLLLAVKGAPGGSAPSTSQVAEMLQQRVHSVVELAGRAAEVGLLEHRTDPGDGRRQLLSLTPLGEEKLAALSVIHRDELRRFRGELAAILHELD
jgi:DNA-binding MarR family transcriptional regulator